MADNKLNLLGTGKFNMMQLTSDAYANYLHFSGVNNYVNLSSTPDYTGKKKLSFYAYLYSDISAGDSGLGAYVCYWDNSSSDPGHTDELTVMFQYYNNHLILQAVVQGTNVNNNKIIANMDSYKGQTIFVEIVKDTGSVTSISINGVSKSLSNGTVLSYGDYHFIGPNGFNSTTLHSILLWDIKLYDETSGETLTHWWKGYPNGNTDNNAWKDQVGSINGTITGTPFGVTSSSNYLLLNYALTTP
jgi:hypothetical protein